MRVTRLLGCLFVVGIVAAGVATGAQEDEVPLYTNADLEKFGPPEPPAPSPPPPAGQNTDGRWDFVQEHLDREYSRIATDRRLDLEESLVDPAPGPEVDGYIDYPVYGRYGLWGYGYYGYGRRGGGNRVRDAFYLYYDQRTARHGYLVPRKNAPPVPESHDVRRGDVRADTTAGSDHRTRGGGRRYRVAVPSRSAGHPEAKAGSSGGGRPTSRGRVSRGSGGRSSSSSRGTARGSSGGRSSGRGGGRRR